MTAMTQDMDAIMREYKNAINVAENEYKISVEAARKALERKKKAARETMQKKKDALMQDLEKRRNVETRRVSENTAATVQIAGRPTVRPVQNSQDKNWNVSWNSRTGVWRESMPVRLFGH